MKNLKFQYLSVMICLLVAGCKTPSRQEQDGRVGKYGKQVPARISLEVVQTIAGNRRGSYTNGPVSVATFQNPSGICVDKKGVLYVADLRNNVIRKIEAGQVTTFAGSGVKGFLDGLGSAARFGSPKAVCASGKGNLYVADTENHCVRKIAPNGHVTTLAGSGSSGYADGKGLAARFHIPSGVCVDAHENVYVADIGNHRIRKISPDGTVSTYAGSGKTGWGSESGGYEDGPALQAKFLFPSGVGIDSKGNIIVADEGNHRIRKISREGQVSTIAGSGPTGYGHGDVADGPGEQARFNVPRGISVHPDGTIFMSDVYNNRIRQISPEGVVTTVAGSSEGFADGALDMAKFNWPMDVAVDLQGNLYVADFSNHSIRLITSKK